MRQLTRGVLATLVVVMAACGSGGDAGAPAATPDQVDDAALAASSRISTPDPTASTPVSLTIAVTSPEGIDSPGLDAAVSVLAGRPDTRIVTIAPAADVRSDPGGRASTALVPVEDKTITGHVASVVNGSMLDAVEAITSAGEVPDLVVIGLTDDTGPESAAMAGAELAIDRGVPVLIVGVGGDDPDLAGAAMLLTMVTDYDLDSIIASASLHVLTVPHCDGGTVRGPVVVDAARPDDALTAIDCTSPDTGPFDTEAEAWAAGHATLAEREVAAAARSGVGQAIP